MTRRLFIGNLQYSTQEQSLHELFSQFGIVEHVGIPKHPVTEQGRGYAYVQMSILEEANTAIMKLRNADFEGREIKVTKAAPSEPGKNPEDEDFDAMIKRMETIFFPHKLS